MKRIIVALAVGSALFGVVAFAAASFNLNAGSLSQQQANVGDCTGGGTVGLAWNTYGEFPVRVTSVDVDASATATGCVGATATVEVFDDGAVPVDAGSCKIKANYKCTADFDGDPDVALVDWARVTLSGP